MEKNSLPVDRKKLDEGSSSRKGDYLGNGGSTVDQTKRQIMSTFKLGFGSEANFGISNMFIVISEGIDVRIERRSNKQAPLTTFTPKFKSHQPNLPNTPILTSEGSTREKVVLTNTLTSKPTLQIEMQRNNGSYKVRNEEIHSIEIGEISFIQDFKSRVYQFIQGKKPSQKKISDLNARIGPEPKKGICFCSKTPPIELTNLDIFGSFTSPLKMTFQENPNGVKGKDVLEIAIRYEPGQPVGLLDILSMISMVQVLALDISSR